MLRYLARVLSEPVMGFLALAALAFGVTPMLFPISPGAQRVLSVGEWLVIALFALEYAVHLRLAPSKRRYLLNPWRVLDLVIILAPLASLLPGVSEAARSSPALRVLRLLRVVLAGTRASTRLRHHETRVRTVQVSGPPQVTRLAGAGGSVRADWREVLAWAQRPEGWLHASHLEPARLEALAQALDLPRMLLDSALGESSYPRLEQRGRWTTLSMWLAGEGGRRDALLLVLAEGGVLSLALRECDLHAPAQALLRDDVRAPAAIVLAVVRLALQRQEEAAGHVERHLRAPVSTSSRCGTRRSGTNRRSSSQGCVTRSAPSAPASERLADLPDLATAGPRIWVPIVASSG